MATMCMNLILAMWNADQEWHLRNIYKIMLLCCIWPTHWQSQTKCTLWCRLNLLFIRLDIGSRCYVRFVSCLCNKSHLTKGISRRDVVFTWLMDEKKQLCRSKRCVKDYSRDLISESSGIRRSFTDLTWN